MPIDLETTSSFDVLDFASDGRLGEFKCIYEKAVVLLNKTNAINKNSEPVAFFSTLEETKEEVDKLVDKYNLLIAMEEKGIHSLPTLCKMKFYELSAQVYAMYAATSSTYAKVSLHYYIKYQVLVQKYKEHKDLQNIDAISVYSFRPVSEYALADLSNDTITVTRPSRMNDPFDSLANLWKKAANLREVTGEKGHEDLLSKSMDYFRIRSFVQLKEGETETSILGNSLLWSNYANNHYGYCVKYRLSKGFIHKIDLDNGIVRRLAPVKYVSNYSINTSVSFIDSYEAYNMKHKIWEYENEIRLLSYNTSTESDYFSEPMANDAVIEEIIFGILCPEQQRLAISNILQNKNIHYYHMMINKEDSIYNLIKEEYIPKLSNHDQTRETIQHH